MVLVLFGAATIVVGTAVALSAQRSRIAARSAAWNAAIPVAEAGIEEALTQLNYGTTNIAANGWRLVNGYYLKTQTNPFSGGGSYYSVAITATNPPVVTSVGYVPAPLQNNYISRTVQITTMGGTSNSSGGLLAKDQIALGGNSLMNSFNSCDPNYSTGGLYDPAKAHDKIKVATDSAGSPAIAVGTTLVYGSVATGPGATISVNNSGGVGDAGYLSGGGTGAIQPGHSANDMNVAIPDVQVPYTDGAPVVLGTYTVGGTNYNYCLGATNYFQNKQFNTSGSMIVTSTATLYVANSFSLSGDLYITPGASLTLYVGVNTKASDSFSISGKGVANGTGLAANFTVYCLSSVKNASYTGGSSWVGVLYAPYTTFSLAGGSDACGSITAYAISLSGGVSFHYDECLGRGNWQPLVVNSWREL
jgi:hypothetical protein